MLTDTSAAGPRNPVSPLWDGLYSTDWIRAPLRAAPVRTGVTLLLVEDRDWSACSGRRPLIFIFGSTRKGPVRAVSLVAPWASHRWRSLGRG